MIRNNLAEGYSPLFFLSALGAGGIAITFFVYLMFMVDHPDTPMVTFNHLWPVITDGHPVAAALVGLAMAAMLLFALLHFRLLIWNLFEFVRYRGTEAHARQLSSNAQVSSLSIPLTLAMSLNLLFVGGAAFVPGIWNVVEFLFPLALAAFAILGIIALRMYAQFFTRVISGGDFDFSDNANLSQLVAVFAFAMIAVGMAAPGAMSHQPVVNALGLFGAVFFATIAMVLGALKLTLGMKSMLRYGISPPAAPSLWIVIPILTLLGIAAIRMDFGLWHGFGVPVSKPTLFILASTILSLQLLFGVLGFAVMKRVNYFAQYVHGAQRHPGSYALICPGVALFVFGMFFINFGLVHNGLVERFSLTYFVILAPLVYVQFKTIVTMLRLNSRLLWSHGELPQTVLDNA